MTPWASRAPRPSWPPGMTPWASESAQYELASGHDAFGPPRAPPWGMARLRLGVALLVPAPAGDEIDGLRRALGDSALARVPPHLTLVPPVNVRQEALPDALATLRSRGRGRAPPVDLTLGPVATFLPVNPVLYLAVGGDLGPLDELRRRVLAGPLGAHPDLAVRAPRDPDRPGPARPTSRPRSPSSASYQASVSVAAVHLLQEGGHGADRRWTPIADVALGPPAVIGRGGLALELTRSESLDPEGAALAMAVAGDGHGMAPSGDDRPPALPSRRPIVITGRREGEVVGVAAAWLTDDGGRGRGGGGGRPSGPGDRRPLAGRGRVGGRGRRLAVPASARVRPGPLLRGPQPVVSGAALTRRRSTSSG